TFQRREAEDFEVVGAASERRARLERVFHASSGRNRPAHLNACWGGGKIYGGSTIDILKIWLSGLRPPKVADYSGWGCPCDAQQTTEPRNTQSPKKIYTYTG